MTLMDDFIPRTLDSADINGLKRHLANWTYLNAYLAQHVPRETVAEMILLELESKNRDFILNRLTSKLGSLIRDEIRSEVFRASQEKKSLQP